jgi:prepilin-type N-terminal cleavage/methylation domain-containing protein
MLKVEVISMYKSSNGMTLIEVMAVALILSVAVVGLWTLFSSSLDLTIQAKEINIMTDDAKDVIEKIKNVNFANLTTVFGNNSAVSPTVVGGFLLTNESIIVRYPDGTDIDPLSIEADVRWTGKDKRDYLRTFKTIRTRGL